MPRLLIFDGETLSPKTFELPPAGKVIVGRSTEAQLRVVNDWFARRHFAFELLEGRWTVSDWGSTNGTTVNGVSIKGPVPLRPGDVISVVETAFLYEEQQERRNPNLEQAIEASPDSAGPFQVWADWLQEQGDPLGEQIARAMHGDAGVEAHLAGGLDPTLKTWRVALCWRLGLIDSVVLRTVGHEGRQPPLRALLSRLLALRTARFLRSLRVDLLGLGGSEDVAAQLEELLSAGLPRTLSTLDLGYGLGLPDVFVPPGGASRIPRVGQTRVFRGRARAQLVGERGLKRGATWCRAWRSGSGLRSVRWPFPRARSPGLRRATRGSRSSTTGGSCAVGATSAPCFASTEPRSGSTVCCREIASKWAAR